jgi:hypothetical protein
VWAAEVKHRVDFVVHLAATRYETQSKVANEVQPFEVESLSAVRPAVAAVA